MRTVWSGEITGGATICRQFGLEKLTGNKQHDHLRTDWAWQTNRKPGRTVRAWQFDSDRGWLAGWLAARGWLAGWPAGWQARRPAGKLASLLTV